MLIYIACKIKSITRKYIYTSFISIFCFLEQGCGSIKPPKVDDASKDEISTSGDTYFPDTLESRYQKSNPEDRKKADLGNTSKIVMLDLKSVKMCILT